MWIILISIILIIVIVEFLYKNATRSGKLINKVPGPYTFPIIGNLWDVYKMTEVNWDYAKELADKYYPMFKVRIFKHTGLALLLPEDAKVLLSCRTNVEKSEFGYDEMRVDGLDGIFLSKGQKWKNRRKLLNPAFRPELIREYAKVLDTYAEDFIKNFLPNGQENILNLRTIFPELAMEIICGTTMGVDVKKIDPNAPSMFVKAFEGIGEATLYFTGRPFIPPWIAKFTSMGRLREKGRKTMNAIVEKIIHERKKYHEQNGFQNLTDDVEDGDTESSDSKVSRKKLGLLDHLLAAELKGLIDEKGIMEELNIAMLGGYDTVSVSIAFTLMLLAENKEAQDLARAEVLKVISENGGSIRTADTSKFVYLECCVKESLRIFPSGPLFGRQLTKDLHLQNDRIIPVKTHVGVPILLIHRDPHFWPEPMKYKPERFLPENSKDRHPCAWLPFSMGPRGCIGQKLGLMEVVCITAHILQNFYIEPVDSTKDVKFITHITLRPSKPIRAKFVRIPKECVNN